MHGSCTAGEGRFLNGFEAATPETPLETGKMGIRIHVESAISSDTPQVDDVFSREFSWQRRANPDGGQSNEQTARRAANRDVQVFLQTLLHLRSLVYLVTFFFCGPIRQCRQIAFNLFRRRAKPLCSAHAV